MGPKWEAAGKVCQFLAVVALAQGISAMSERVLSAVDQTHVVFRFGVLDACLTLAAFAFGLRWGIVGVAVAYTAVEVPIQVLYLARAGRSVSISMGTIVWELGRVLIAAGVMTAACVGLRAWLVSAGISVAARFAAVVLCGIFVYVVGCAILEPRVWREAYGLVRGRRPPSPAMVAA